MREIQRKLQTLAVAQTVAPSSVYANACGEGAREIGRLDEAFGMCLTGGNHIASVLISRLGGDFSSKYPKTMPYEEALQAIGAGDTYDVWCCWSAMMRARDLRDGKPIPVG